MQTELLTFENFSLGAQTQKNKYLGGFAAMVNLNLIDEPGVLRLNYLMNVETEAASTNDITTTITDIEPYTGNASYTLYAIGGTGNRIYARNTSNVWTLVHDDANTGPGFLRVFGSNLYWTSISKLGKYDGTTWTDAFQSLSTSSFTPNPIEIFAGLLCVGNGRYIDTLDADGTTWTTAKVTLPLGVQIKDMRVWNEKLSILCSTADGTGRTLLFQWDGNTDGDYEEPIVVFDTTPRAIFNFNNHLMLWTDSKIYEFNGASFDVFRSDIDGMSGPGSITMHQGSLLFGADMDGRKGVFALSQVDANSPIILSLYTGTSQRNFTATIGAIYSTGVPGSLQVAWSESSTFAMDLQSATERWSSWLSGPAYTAIAFVDTILHDFGDPNIEKVVVGIKLHVAEPLAGTSNANGTGHTITVLTDPNRTGTFTEQRIVYKGTEENVQWFDTPIPCKVLQARLAFSWTNSGSIFANLKGYTLYYQKRGPLFAR